MFIWGILIPLKTIAALNDISRGRRSYDCLPDGKSFKTTKFRPPQTSYHEVLDEITDIIDNTSSVDIALHLNLSLMNR